MLEHCMEGGCECRRASTALLAGFFSEGRGVSGSVGCVCVRACVRPVLGVGVWGYDDGRRSVLTSAYEDTRGADRTTPRGGQASYNGAHGGAPKRCEIKCKQPQSQYTLYGASNGVQLISLRASLVLTGSGVGSARGPVQCQRCAEHAGAATLDGEEAPATHSCAAEANGSTRRSSTCPDLAECWLDARHVSVSRVCVLIRTAPSRIC
eukprot:665428-Rhodomonas_salina.1